LVSNRWGKGEAPEGRRCSASGVPDEAQPSFRSPVNRSISRNRAQGSRQRRSRLIAGDGDVVRGPARPAAIPSGSAARAGKWPKSRLPACGCTARTRRAERECVPLASPVFWRVGVAWRRGRKRRLLRCASTLEVALGHDFTSNCPHLSTPAVGDSPFIESQTFAEKFQAMHWRSQWQPAVTVHGGLSPSAAKGTGTFFGLGRIRQRTPGEPKKKPVPDGL
jgi:hypothetical protein